MRRAEAARVCYRYTCNTTSRAIQEYGNTARVAVILQLLLLPCLFEDSAGGYALVTYQLCLYSFVLCR